MEALKYIVIKSDKQYYKYCDILEELVFSDNIDYLEEIELLTLLMEDHRLSAKDLAEIIGLTKGTVSKILNYQKGFSKETIRKLSAHFKLRQEAFNRPYSLVGQAQKDLQKAS
jgi:HTH-type transcriptional regulator/antitoxin HigA